MLGHPWNWKTDPRHEEIITETCCLKREEVVKTPKRSMDDVNNAREWSGDHATISRSVCILFVVKKMTKWMFHPNIMKWEMVKRCRRYSLGQSRMVQRFVKDSTVDTTTLKVDSDRAGCLRTRISTIGIGAHRGKHVIKGSVDDTNDDRVVKESHNSTRLCVHSHSVWNQILRT